MQLTRSYCDSDMHLIYIQNGFMVTIDKHILTSFQFNTLKLCYIIKRDIIQTRRELCEFSIIIQRER